MPRDKRRRLIVGSSRKPRRDLRFYQNCSSVSEIRTKKEKINGHGLKLFTKQMISMFRKLFRLMSM